MGHAALRAARPPRSAPHSPTPLDPAQRALAAPPPLPRCAGWETGGEAWEEQRRRWIEAVRAAPRVAEVARIGWRDVPSFGAAASPRAVGGGEGGCGGGEGEQQLQTLPRHFVDTS